MIDGGGKARDKMEKFRQRLAARPQSGESGINERME